MARIVKLTRLANSGSTISALAMACEESSHKSRRSAEEFSVFQVLIWV